MAFAVLFNSNAPVLLARTQNPTVIRTTAPMKSSLESSLFLLRSPPASDDVADNARHVHRDKWWLCGVCVLQQRPSASQAAGYSACTRTADAVAALRRVRPTWYWQGS
ncbi:unnamed protein product [Boreogadus saida]